MATAKKTTTKAAATKAAATTETKAPAKRATVKTTVNFEMGDVSVTAADVQKLVKADVKAKGLQASAIDIYINTAERIAYYTVNGEGSEDYKVALA